MWWITEAHDGNYWLTQAERRPDNAIRGPFGTQDAALSSMRRREGRENHAENAAAWVVVISLSIGFVALGFALARVL